MDKNAVGWFEIPVADMGRAMKFYEDVFSVKLSRHTLPELDMAWFPWIENGVGSAGALVLKKEHYKPSATDGVLIYFTTPSGDLGKDLKNVVKAGGKILRERSPIGEYGFMALFLDSEGNRIALHSRK